MRGSSKNVAARDSAIFYARKISTGTHVRLIKVPRFVPSARQCHQIHNSHAQDIAFLEHDELRQTHRNPHRRNRRCSWSVGCRPQHCDKPVTSDDSKVSRAEALDPSPNPEITCSCCHTIRGNKLMYRTVCPILLAHIQVWCLPNCEPIFEFDKAKDPSVCPSRQNGSVHVQRTAIVTRGAHHKNFEMDFVFARAGDDPKL